MTAIAYTARMRDHSEWMPYHDAEEVIHGKVRDISGRKPVAIERHLYKPIARLLYTKQDPDRDRITMNLRYPFPIYMCFDTTELERAARLFPHLPGSYKP